MVKEKKPLEQFEDLYHKYKSYIYNCSDGVYLTDENGRFIEVNPTGYLMLGYSEEELLSMSIVDVSDQDNLEPSLEHFRDLQLFGSSCKTLNLVKKDGSKIIVENKGVKIGNCYIGFVRDITKRTMLENELKVYREQLEMMVEKRTKELQEVNRKLTQEIEERKKMERELQMKSSLLDAASDTIVAHDLAGNFIYANETAYKTTGYDKEDFMAKNLSDINSHRFSEMITARTKVLLEKGQTSFEAEHLCANGKTFPVEVNARVLELENRNETIILSVVRNITERKKLEKEIAKMARLSAVAEMATTVAHEIRNPMTAVRGLLQILTTKEDCPHFRQYSDLMLEELDRANSIITDYFSLAKDNKVIKQRQNINSIINIILPLIETKASLSDKHIVIGLDEVPDILLDEKEIRQLILNLTLNGLEAMQSNGTLSISTYMLGQDVVLEVKDEGSGIDPSIMDKLGTPFLTTKDQGTGLGLSVCYSIAKRHNADIKIETGPKGTTFMVVFRTNG